MPFLYLTTAYAVDCTRSGISKLLGQALVIADFTANRVHLLEKDRLSMRKKPLPIGISDFKILIDDGYTYVDKTLLIQEIMETEARVALIPRMRRFGKTLNLSMLRYFFEKSDQDPSLLFKDLNIWKQENIEL